MKEHIALRREATALEPLVRIGKNGLTKGVIEEIKVHLKKRRLIKIRFLKNVISEGENRKSALKGYAEKIAAETGSQFVQAIGFNIVLKRVER